MVAVIGRRFARLSPREQRLISDRKDAKMAGGHRRLVAVPTIARQRGGPAVADADVARAVLLEASESHYLRADGWRTRVAVIEALLAHMSWRSGMVTASHAQLAVTAERVGGRGRVGRATVGNHIRALVKAGALSVEQSGFSKALSGIGRNIAPTYAVRGRDEQLSGPEQLAARELAERLEHRAGDEVGHLVVHAVDLGTVGENHRHLGGKIDRPDSLRRGNPERYAPRTAAERTDAVAWLAGVLKISYRFHGAGLRKACSAFFAAGWSPEAVLYAAEHAPGEMGARDSPLADAVWKLRLLNWRLSRWRDTAREPLAPPVAAHRLRRGPRPRPAIRVPAPPPLVATRAPDGARQAMRAAIEAGKAGLAAQAAVLRDQRRIYPRGLTA